MVLEWEMFLIIKIKEKGQESIKLGFLNLGQKKDIRRAGKHVASLKTNKHTTNEKAMFGIYKGVKVGVIKTHGRIGTVFPDSNQNSIYRRKKK